MKTIEDYKERIPDYALSYLVNNDSSGIDDADVKAIDAFMQWYYDKAKEVNGYVIFACGDGDGSFDSRPAFGLACNTVECEILICVND